MITIYGVPISVHTRKAILAARYKGIEHELKYVFPFDPPPGWNRLSPTGLIPAMEHGSLALADSSAICRYLDLIHPASPIYPAEHRAHAQALSIEAYIGATFFRNVLHGLFHQKFIRPRVRNEPTDEGELARILTVEQPPVLAYLDDLCGDEFLVGATLSIADITLASNLITYCYIGYRRELDAYPRLSAWFDRVLALRSVQQVLRDERPTVDEMGLDGGLHEA